jgi:hypothetical protein
MRFGIRVAIYTSLITSCAGCFLVNNQLKKEFQENSAIAAACQNTQMSETILKKNYQNTLSDLALSAVKFSVVGDPTKTTFKSTLLAIKTDFSGIYQNSDAPSRKALSALKKDTEVLQTNAEQLGQKLSAALKAQLTAHPVSIDKPENAINDFTLLIKTSVATITADASSLRLDIANIKVDFDDLKNDLITNKQFSVAITNSHFFDHLKAAGDALDKLVSAGAKFSIDDDETKGQLGKVLQQYGEYEIARLTLNDVQRGAIHIEHKLDTLDQKTWLVISVLEWIVDPEIATTLEDAIKNQVAPNTANAQPKGLSTLTKISVPPGPNPTISYSSSLTLEQTVKDGIYDGLYIAACQHLNEQAGSQTADSVRSDELLHPLYAALAIRYAQTSKKGPGSLARSNETTTDQEKTMVILQQLNENVQEAENKLLAN